MSLRMVHLGWGVTGFREKFVKLNCFCFNLLNFPARPVMLRLFILSLFAMAVFLLAAPGVQELVAHTESLTKARAAGIRTAQGETTDPRPCDARASGSSVSDGCSATQTCATCNICQVCHQAAIVQTPSPAMLTVFTWIASPQISAGNASADHAPSLKPPIL